MCRGCGKVVKTGWQVVRPLAITSRSSQLLMMGTWLPETCWASIRREIKNTKSDIYLVFLIHTELRCTVNHTSDSWVYIYGRSFKLDSGQNIRKKIFWKKHFWMDSRNNVRIMITLRQICTHFLSFLGFMVCESENVATYSVEIGILFFYYSSIFKLLVTFLLTNYLGIS